MSAGGSQAVQAVERALELTALEQQVRQVRGLAGRHRAGCTGERDVCQALSRLALEGVHHLDDRRWAADERLRLNADHIVIAPTGVFVVDAKNWAGRITRSDSGQLLEDGRPRNERLIALGWLRGKVAEAVATTSAARINPVSLICFAKRQPGAQGSVGQILLSDVESIGDLITRRSVLLTPEEIAELVDVLAYSFPPYETDAQAEAEAAGLLFPDEVTRNAGLQEALRRPVEDWMAWLHPTQAAVVQRSFAGPARIRGAAGTGKTSVGLHRVAWLAATRPGRFLVTSFVKTLPPSLAEAYRRLSPTTADRVDFEHVHGVAVRLLRDAGRDVRLDNGNTAFALAWRKHSAALDGWNLSREYFREEITHVIKGRGLTRIEDYQGLVRVGRRTPLGPSQREKVWRLYEDYQAELRGRGLADMTDLLRLALEVARGLEVSPWRGVVVDEVQDLPMVGLQLLHVLAGGDRSDGLLLIGDGQQAIYPGGFTLVEAGVDIANRGVVLKVNYRNTVEILAAARLVVLGDEYDDLDATPSPGERDTEVVRHGEVPLVTTYASIEEHDGALEWEIQRLLDSGVQPEAIAVLCQTNVVVGEYAGLLRRAGVECALLASSSADAAGVRVGTWARSKGMEFPHVFVPQANRRSLLVTGGGEAAAAEKEALFRRQQYVAMTRARDTLWVGHL